MNNSVSEVWKPVKGYEGEYEVSDLGNVRSIKFGKVITLKTFDSKGYKKVSLYLNGKMKHHHVHRLVAEAFIDNPLNKEYVNHKDGVKGNNVLGNLEWVTPSENSIHAYKNGLAKVPVSQNAGKRVLQIDKKTGEILQEFPSVYSAGRETGIDRMGIKRVCRGVRKTAGGYIWRHKESRAATRP
ncbi:NUMOD4 domain-containing protein [Siminovitchia sp. FSL W7-1587]|uniref:NUMOD4 domain-containing protein n=1 Tax=Siminovitchia sp. FSL W7-1587 TaxID=2954699 RepID=UPI0030D0CCF0